MFSIITNDRIFLYLTYQTCIRIKIILRKIHRQLNIVQEKAWISKNVWNFKKWLTWRCKSKLSFSLSLSVSSFLSPISESRIHPKKIQTKYPPFILACNVLFFFTSILLHIKFYISMKNSSIQFYFHPLFKYNFIFLVVFFVFFSRFNWIFRFSFFFTLFFFICFISIPDSLFLILLSLNIIIIIIIISSLQFSTFVLYWKGEKKIPYWMLVSVDINHTYIDINEPYKYRNVWKWMYELRIRIYMSI